MRTVPIVVIVLIIAAVVLGYSVYTKVFKSSTNLQNISSKANRQSDISRLPQATASALQKPPWLNSLSKSDQALFNTPAPDAEAEERQKFSETLRANAKSASEIRILKDCQPQPLVLALENNLTFKVKNADKIPHGIRINPNVQYVLNPGEVATIKLEQARSLSFGCDPYGPVGFLVAPL